MKRASGPNEDCQTEYCFNVTGDPDKIAELARATSAVVQFAKAGDMYLIVPCRDKGEAVDSEQNFRWVASRSRINSTREALMEAKIVFTEDANGNHAHDEHSLREESPTEVTVVPQESDGRDESTPAKYVEHLTEAIAHLSQGDLGSTMNLSDAEIAMRAAGKLGQQKDKEDW